MTILPCNGLANALGFGSCGSWVVDPVTEFILGIVVAHSEDQSLTWMLPADPIFADIERRWGVELTTENKNLPPRPLTLRLNRSTREVFGGRDVNTEYKLYADNVFKRIIKHEGKSSLPPRSC
jgi:hypothetical protein